MLSFLLSFEPFSYILPLFFFFSLLHSLSLHYFICVPLFDLPMLIRMHAILYLSLSCTAVISHCELFNFTKVTTWRGFFVSEADENSKRLHVRLQRTVQDTHQTADYTFHYSNMHCTVVSGHIAKTVCTFCY